MRVNWRSGVEWSGGCCQSVRRDGFKFMTRLGSGTEREGDVDAQAHQRISLFEKCLYLLALSLVRRPDSR